MASVPVIHLASPLAAVSVISSSTGSGDSFAAAEQTPASISDHPARLEATKELEQQKEAFRDACLALHTIVDRLNQLYEDIFAGHNEAIARLSVEIARKVIAQKVSNGDYDIESIIQETLKNAPEQSGLMVRLNPRDLADLRTLQHDNPNAVFDGMELTADPGIGRAECVIESAKGIVKLLIDEHLEQISQALIKTG